MEFQLHGQSIGASNFSFSNEYSGWISFRIDWFDLFAVQGTPQNSLLCWHFSRVRLFATPWTVAHQAPLPTEFSRQEHWSGLPFSSPGDLPDPGIGLGPPALQADSLPSKPPGKPQESSPEQFESINSLVLSLPSSLSPFLIAQGVLPRLILGKSQ